MSQPVSPEQILQTGFAFWPSKTLLSAVELGVFTDLARGPGTFDVLSGRLGLHPRSARDFLDTLVALGFLQRAGEVYSNTPETDLFLDRKKPFGGGLVLVMRRLRVLEHQHSLPGSSNGVGEIRAPLQRAGVRDARWGRRAALATAALLLTACT
jgi:hypothetical protein